MHHLLRIWVGIVICLISGQIHAAGAPDAGQLLQQIEKERGATLPNRVTPEITPTAPPLKSIEGAVVTVTAFNFEGNNLLKSDELATIVAEYLNRPLEFSDLQKAAAAVAEHYRQAGWVVRAYLPKQDITGGIVTIRIVEAIFGGTRLETEPKRLSQAIVLTRVAAVQTEGAPLNATKLDRALLLLDDLPGITATGSLGKGKNESETELLIKTSDEPLLIGNVSADNTGARATGSERVSATAYLNSPLRIGDQVTANLIHSRGNDYGRVAYSIPVGADGWRVGASGSYLSYNLISDNFKGLDANGTSSTIGLDTSYPIIRSRLKNLILGLNLDHKHFDNQALQATTTNYDINNLVISLNGNLFDKLGGGGANSAGLSLTQGSLNLNGSPNQAADAHTIKTDGDFTKLNYFLSRQQVITDTLTAYAGLSGQIASKNLDSAEKFYLGGAYGVRAYPANESGGSDGQLLNLELRSHLFRTVTLTGFYDLGHVRVNHDNDIVRDPNNSLTLKGAGLSVAWMADFGLNLKATWAHRIGDNPNPTTNGNDQDGSLHQNRFWLQATMSF